MTGNDILQILFYFGVLLLLAKPLGVYMARVYEGQPSGLDRVLGPVERLFYRICGIKPDEEMSWKKYAVRCSVQRGGIVLPLSPSACAGNAALESAKVPGSIT